MSRKLSTTVTQDYSHSELVMVWGDITEFGMTGPKFFEERR